MTTARNWAGNVVFGARQLHRPTSVVELQGLVADSDRIRALGSGHSFSPIADTTGDLVVFTTPPERLRDLWPRLPDAEKLFRTADPTGKFRNEMLDRLLPG